MKNIILIFILITTVSLADINKVFLSNKLGDIFKKNNISVGKAEGYYIDLRTNSDRKIQKVTIFKKYKNNKECIEDIRHLETTIRRKYNIEFQQLNLTESYAEINDKNYYIVFDCRDLGYGDELNFSMTTQKYKKDLEIYLKKSKIIHAQQDKRRQIQKIETEKMKKFVNILETNKIGDVLVNNNTTINDKVHYYITDNEKKIYRINFKKEYNHNNVMSCWTDLAKFETKIKKEYNIKFKKRNYRKNENTVFDREFYLNFECKYNKNKKLIMNVIIEDDTILAMDLLQDTQKIKFKEFDKEFNKLKKSDFYSKEYNGIFKIKFGDYIPSTKNIIKAESYHNRGLEKLIIPKMRIPFFEEYSVQPKYNDNKIYRINLKKEFNHYIKNIDKKIKKRVPNRSSYESVEKKECEIYKKKLVSLFENEFKITPIQSGVRTLFYTNKKTAIIMCVHKDKKEYYDSSYLLLLSYTKNEENFNEGGI